MLQCNAGAGKLPKMVALAFRFRAGDCSWDMIQPWEIGVAREARILNRSKSLTKKLLSIGSEGILYYTCKEPSRIIQATVSVHPFHPCHLSLTN